MDTKSLTKFLTRLLSTRPEISQWYAEILAAAGLYPMEGEDATLAGAINLMLALALASSPGEAVAVVETYGVLPQQTCRETTPLMDGSEWLSPTKEVADISIPPGRGSAFNEATRTLTGHLIQSIQEFEPLPDDTEYVRAAMGITWFAAVVDLAHPSALAISGDGLSNISAVFNRDGHEDPYPPTMSQGVSIPFYVAFELASKFSEKWSATDRHRWNKLIATPGPEKEPAT